MPTVEELEEKLKQKDEQEKKGRGAKSDTPKRENKPKAEVKKQKNDTDSSAKTIKKVNVERHFEVNDEVKRHSISYHIHPDYDEVLLKIQYINRHKKKGGTIEWLIDHFLSSLPEPKRKELLRLNLDSDY